MKTRKATCCYCGKRRMCRAIGRQRKLACKACLAYGEQRFHGLLAGEGHTVDTLNTLARDRQVSVLSSVFAKSRAIDEFHREIHKAYLSSGMTGPEFADWLRVEAKRLGYDLDSAGPN